MIAHLLYNQVLDQNKSSDRYLGIMAGAEYLLVAKKQIFYIDYGMSPGMVEAEAIGKEYGIKQEYRKLHYSNKTQKELDINY